MWSGKCSFPLKHKLFPTKAGFGDQTLCDQMPLSNCMVSDLSYLSLLIYEMGMLINFVKLLKELNEIIHVKLVAACLIHNKQSINVSCHFIHTHVYAYIMLMTFYFYMHSYIYMLLLLKTLQGSMAPWIYHGGRETFHSGWFQCRSSCKTAPGL